MHDILYEKNNGIATITLNRPKVLNALRGRTYFELASAVRDFVDDRDSKILVLTGSGRAFCAGQDLKDIPAHGEIDDAMLREQLDVTQEISRLLFGCAKPTIAAINGLAVGAGAEIPLSCSLRIAARDGFFQFAEIRNGLFQTNGTTYLLPRLVGVGRATQMLLMGERVPAESALKWGLVNNVVEPGDLRTAVDDCALELMATPERCRRLILEGLRTGMETTFENCLQFETAGNLQLVLPQASDRG